ncbi:Hypothetical predicted protein, partial [Olea europaea subsp. europaea]
IPATYHFSRQNFAQISSLKADEIRFWESANTIHGSPKAKPVYEEKKVERVRGDHMVKNNQIMASFSQSSSSFREIIEEES